MAGNPQQVPIQAGSFLLVGKMCKDVGSFVMAHPCHSKSSQNRKLGRSNLPRSLSQRSQTSFGRVLQLVSVSGDWSQLSPMSYFLSKFQDETTIQHNENCSLSRSSIRSCEQSSSTIWTIQHHVGVRLLVSGRTFQ